MSEIISNTIQNLCLGQSLSRQASSALFARIVRGELTDVEISAVLVALKAKGETTDEIAGAAEALRTSARLFNAQNVDSADTCGTGGDGAQTVNISTAAALVAAQAGVAVAKHGNRAVSSRCGSADVLERCGVKIDADPRLSERSLQELGICFLFAPVYHAGMRHAMPVRQRLGVRTMFNLLGPLANPARPRWQVVGVYEPRLCQPLAETLGKLGCESALVVHGSGIDEIALHADTCAALWQGGEVRQMVIKPEELKLTKCSLDELRGGTIEENAGWLREVLSGGGSRAHREAVALNAGALLWLVGRARDLKEGLAEALNLLAFGQTIKRLVNWAEISHGA